MRSIHTVFVVAYFAAMALEVVLRLPYSRLHRRTEKKDRRIDIRERIVLAALSLGTLLLPLIYALTPWLDFADYRLPQTSAIVLGVLGLPLLAAAVWVLWRAHRDLGAGWSPSLEIAEGQRLITTGIYGSVRHPMYASLLLWSLAQPLLLQNWVAGPPGLAVLLLALLLRVPGEERMMLDHFGDEYRAYSLRTGRVLPRINVFRGERG